MAVHKKELSPTSARLVAKNYQEFPKGALKRYGGASGLQGSIACLVKTAPTPNPEGSTEGSRKYLHLWDPRRRIAGS